MAYTENEMNILIADDHTLNRNLLQGLLEAVYPQAKLFEASDYASTKQMSKKHKPDLLILDVSMPGHSGLHGVFEIVREFPDTKVLVCSAIENPILIRTMLSFGIRGYIPKTMPANELLKAIETVLQGEVYVPDEILAESPIQLTARQAEILGLICTGVSNKEISKQLGISVHTVKLHVSAVLDILGVQNRQQAVGLCGLMPAEQGEEAHNAAAAATHWRH